MTVFLRGEGWPDVAALERICVHCGFRIADLSSKYEGGYAALDRNIPKYLQAGRQVPFIVLRDLDAIPCAPDYLKEHVPKTTRYLTFRLAVREVESWFLADSANLASFLLVSRALVPTDPESLPDPKQAMLDLIRHSRSRVLKEDMLPIDTSGNVGPGYPDQLAIFARSHWDILKVLEGGRCDSLARAVARIGELKSLLEIDGVI